jgi:hypothetical protein
MKFCVGVEPNPRIEMQGLFLALLFRGCGCSFLFRAGFLFLGHSESQHIRFLQMIQIKIISENKTNLTS